MADANVLMYAVSASGGEHSSNNGSLASPRPTRPTVSMLHGVDVECLAMSPSAGGKCPVSKCPSYKSAWESSKVLHTDGVVRQRSSYLQGVQAHDSKSQAVFLPRQAGTQPRRSQHRCPSNCHLGASRSECWQNRLVASLQQQFRSGSSLEAIAPLHGSLRR